MMRKSGQKGYSLIEALVVVAIVGMVSVVTIPNFVQYMRSAKLKNAARQFSIDLRETRQLAVTRYRPAKVSFKAGVGLNDYFIAEGEIDSSVAGGIAWTKIGENESFEESVYFESTTLSDGADADDWIDVVFMPNGKIFSGTTSTGSGVDLPASATIKLQSTDDIPKTSYLVELHSTGKIRMQ